MFMMPHNLVVYQDTKRSMPVDGATTAGEHQNHPVAWDGFAVLGVFTQALQRACCR